MATVDELFTKVVNAITALQAAQQTVTNAATQFQDAMHLTGDEVVSGTKTFATSPVVPTPQPGDNSALVANTAFVKKALDDKMSSIEQRLQALENN